MAEQDERKQDGGEDSATDTGGGNDIGGAAGTPGSRTEGTGTGAIAGSGGMDTSGTPNLVGTSETATRSDLED